MISRRVLMSSLGGLLFSEAARSQGNAGSTSRAAFQHDLPDITLKGWYATTTEVSYKPGESSAAHRHPGITIAYVLEGEIRSKVGDEPEKTYTVGQVFFENPGDLHAVSGNASTTRPAKLLAVMLAPKGVPLLTPAQE